MKQQRAPAARSKLHLAEETLASLMAEVASLALEASEGKGGAERALAAHRLKVEAAERQASDLRRAVELAERLDREASATAAARMRREQMVAFQASMQIREREMAAVLEAIATAAAAYGRFSEASLSAQIAAPTGTSVVPMTMGPEGLYGHAFGPCEQLILSELYRLAPERADGLGRFVVPFAKPFAEAVRHNPAAIPPGIDAMRAASQAILADIEKQISALDQRAMAAASAAKEAA